MDNLLKITVTTSIFFICFSTFAEVQKKEIIKFTPIPRSTPIIFPKLNYIYFTTSTKNNKILPENTKIPNNNIPVVTPLSTKVPLISPTPGHNIPVVTPVSIKPSIAKPVPVYQKPNVSETIQIYPVVTPVRKTNISTPKPWILKKTPVPIKKVTKNKKFKISWNTDYTKAYKKSKKSNKLILVFIGSEKCKECENLKKDVKFLFLDDYEKVYLDKESNKQYKKYFSKYNSVPTLLIINNSDSRIVKKIVNYKHSDFNKLSEFFDNK